MSLLLWMPLFNSLENKGSCLATITSSNVTVDNGKVGECYAFDGTAYIKIISPQLKAYFNSPSKPFTLSTWIYCNTDETDRAIIFGNYNTTRYINWELAADRRQRLTTSSSYNKYSTTTVPVETWVHIAVTYDGTTTTFYQNGALAQSFTGNNALGEGTTSDTWYLGSDSRSGATRLKGKLNDFRVYNTCLSAIEVHELSLGLILHYKLDNNSLGNPNLLYGTADPKSTPGSAFISIKGTKLANGNGSTYTSQTRSNRLHGIQSTTTSGARPYVALGHPTASTCLAAPDPMWGLIAGKTYTFSGDLEYKVYSNNLELTASYFIIRLYYIKSEETAWTNAGNLKTFTTVPAQIHNYHFELPFTIPENAISWYILIASNNSSSSNNAAGDYVAIDNIKLEEGNKATIYLPAIQDFSAEDQYKIIDSSGYDRHGQYTPDSNIKLFSLSNDTKRYSINNFYLNGDAGYIQSPILIFSKRIYTINFWIKSNDNVPTESSTYHAIITDDNTLCRILTNDPSYQDINIRTGLSYSSWQIFAGVEHTRQLFDGQWHMFTLISNETQASIYLDKNLIYTVDINNTNNPVSTTLYLGSKMSYYINVTDTYISDFRFYTTVLSLDDIQNLYETTMFIDNQNSCSPFEINELESLSMIKTTGVLTTNNFREECGIMITQYDSTIYTEPDGSQWVHIFHHENPTNAKFSDSTSDWSEGKYIDSTRWYDIEKILNNSLQYEFLYKQKTTAEASEVKYRWIQPINPLIATWEDVKPGTCTYNTSSGYTNSSYGGMYLFKNSNLHMCIANSSKGNWYGGLGACNAYNGGIPGFPNTVVTTGTIDLYIRIFPETAIVNNSNITSTEFIER